MSRDKLIKILLFVLLPLGIVYFLFLADKETLLMPIVDKTEVKKEILIGNKKLLVDIADEPSEQEQGLSGRKSLGIDEGLLFIFPSSTPLMFWMKNMNFPIDIIWIDENMKVIGITKNLSPDTFPATFSPPLPAKYVIEVNAGWSDINKVRIGDVVKLSQ